MNEKGTSLLLLASVFPLVASCAQPRDTYQTAQVRIEGGHVCYSVNDTAESRSSPPRLAAVTVDREIGGSRETIWALDLTSATPHASLAPGECLRHGVDTLGGIQLKEPAPLGPGEHYSVAINAFIKAPPTHADEWLNRRYSQEFCIAQGAQVSVVTVSRTGGKPDWEVCSPAPAELPRVSR